MIKLQNEDHLLGLLRAGDTDAFRKIYNFYGKKLFYFAKKLNLDAEDAEEIVQETFAKIWENRAGLQTGFSLNAYLMTISRNLIYNKVRKEALIRRYMGVFKEPELDVIPDKELETSIEQILEQLPEKCRLVFRMSRFEGYSNQEIADKLSISKSTVENHINKAIHLIKTQLKGYGFGSYVMIYISLFLLK
ncbi:RNA polymerase sigma factor [Pedobacter deserti]|uniref:RNA polymerase sigma factor n=1 Tax=Pedobacter deserti TaxID=2817382 RepID=UPI00210C7570|nr:RNA polymerase sigma-70 factor [Pedobacter sp. SYSU D00382]